MAKTEIGDLIGESRSKQALTQDQFGKKYGVSGPAIFKFEKGYVKPSLDLWLSMAKDMTVSEQQAVLMWVRGKLPRKYQSFVSLDPKAVAESAAAYKGKGSKKAQTPDALRKDVLGDRKAPKGLKQLLRDDDIWALYKPKAEELILLRDVFGALGDGSKSSYREALNLVRQFGDK